MAGSGRWSVRLAVNTWEGPSESGLEDGVERDERVFWCDFVDVKI